MRRFTRLTNGFSKKAADHAAAAALLIFAATAFVLGIAVGALSYWFAETSGPMAFAAIAALGASLVLSYVVSPVLAIKGIIELVRPTSN